MVKGLFVWIILYCSPCARNSSLKHVAHKIFSNQVVELCIYYNWMSQHVASSVCHFSGCVKKNSA